MVVRVASRWRRALGAEDAQPESPAAIHGARPGGQNPDAPPPRLGERALLVPAPGRDGGIEDYVRAELGQHLRGAADVVSLRVRENDGREAAAAEAPQLIGDVSL